MKKHLLSILLVLSSVAATFSQTDSVYYHHPTFTSQYGANGGYPSTNYYRYVTRFTPPYYPAQLVGIKAWFRNAGNPSQFNWVAYLDPTGAATGPSGSAAYLSTGNYTNPAQGGVQDSAYADSINLTSQNIILQAGDVYGGVTQYLQSNGFPGIAIDTSNALGATNRPWIYGGGWEEMVMGTAGNINGEWGLTAYFIPSTVSTRDLNSNDFSVEIYPQPMNTDANVFYSLQENSSVSISVYNSIGEKAMSDIVKNENQSAGNYSIPFSVSNLSAGIYFLRLKVNDELAVKKLVVIK